MTEYRDDILRKRTLLEAQMFVLDKRSIVEAEQAGSDVFDLSVPISEKSSSRARIPEPELRIPKGYF
jgi:hypothetical protein